MNTTMRCIHNAYKWRVERARKQMQKKKRNKYIVHGGIIVKTRVSRKRKSEELRGKKWRTRSPKVLAVRGRHSGASVLPTAP